MTARRSGGIGTSAGTGSVRVTASAPGSVFGLGEEGRGVLLTQPGQRGLLWALAEWVRSVTTVVYSVQFLPLIALSIRRSAISERYGLWQRMIVQPKPRHAQPAARSPQPAALEGS